MKFLLSLTLVLFLITPFGVAEVETREVGNLVLEDIPEIPDQLIERMQQYRNTRSASLQGWLPSGEILISTRFGETRQIHRVSFPKAAREQLTFFSEPVSSATASPNAEINGFLFAKDVGGSEFYQLFFFDLATGEHTMLTDGTSRNGAPLWSRQGQKFAYYSTKRNQRDWDLYVASISQPHKAERVLEEGGTWIPVDWSPDDQRLLVQKYVSITESYYYILDVTTKELSQVYPSDETISYGAALWAPDGKGIYLACDLGSEFQKLRYYDVAKQSFTTLTPEIDWDVETLALSPDGKSLVFVVNEGGISQLYLRDLAQNYNQKIAGIPQGVVYGLHFHPTQSQLGLVINTPKTPGDVYTFDLQNNEWERWTHSEVGGLQTENFVTPSLIHYPTFDKENGKQRQIPAFYYRPQKQAKQPFPVVIAIHGGPEGQYRPYFRSSVQYYVNEMGFAVLAPNVRGSAGYGKSYLKLDNVFKREDSVKDIGALLDWIAKQPELDSNRVAVLGGSYGGYMVLASMIHYSDRLQAGVDVVGISNFVTFLKNTKDYRRDLRRVEYGDERDPEVRDFLHEISPTTHAGKISKPMFVLQGLNDPRVPVSESEQIVEMIRKNGEKVWYLLAKDEGHGFRKKSNADFVSYATALFLKKFVAQEHKE